MNPTNTPQRALWRSLQRPATWARASAAALLLAGASAWWWSGSEGSLASSLNLTRHLLPAGMQLQSDGVRGSLRQGGHVERLVWQQGGLTVSADQVELGLNLRRVLNGQLPLHTLRVGQLQVSDARADSPSSPLASLAFPWRADVVWQVDWLRWHGAAETSTLQGHYAFDGLHHKLHIHRLQWAQGLYSGQISVQAQHPLQVQAELTGELPLPQSTARAGATLQARALVQGPLAGTDARQHLQLHLAPSVGTRPQLNLQGQLQLQGTPALVSLQAQLQGMDLAALWPSAPHTLIDGQVDVSPHTSGWQVHMRLDNGLPGPLDAQRIPLTHLQATVQNTEAGWHAPQLLARWPGGQMQGQGQWQAQRWTGDWRVQGLQPGQWWSALQGPALSGRIQADQMRHEPLTLQAMLQPGGPGAASALSPGLKLQARADAQTWTLTQLEWRWLDAVLQAQGQWQPGRQRIDGQVNWQMPGLQGRIEGFASPQDGHGNWHVQGNDLTALQVWLRQWPGAAHSWPQWLQSRRLEASGQWQGGWATSGMTLQARMQAAPWQLQTRARVAQHHSAGDWRLAWQQFELALTDKTKALAPLRLQLDESEDWQWHAPTQQLRWGRQRWRLLDEQHSASLTVDRGDWQAAGADSVWPTLHVSAHATDWPLRWTRWLGLPETRGDLLLNAGLALEWTRKPHARVWLERSRGDLQVGTDPVQNVPVQAGVRTARAQLQLDGEQARLEWAWDSARAGQLQGQASSRLDLGAPSVQTLWPQQAPLSGQLNARLPRVGAWAWLAPPGWRVEGTLDAQAEFSGTRARPQWQGRVQADDLALRSAVEGVEFRQGRLRARLQEQQMVLESFELQGTGAAGGSLSAQGLVRWQDSANTLVEAVQMELQMQAKGLRVTSRADRRLSVSGDVNARVQNGQMQLRGTLQADSALFILSDDNTPVLDKDVRILQTPTAPRTLASAPGLSLTGLPDVQVLLRLGPDFRLRGQGIETRLAGEVQLSSNDSTAGRPRLRGEVRTVGGRYRAYRQELDIEQGVLRFTGPYDNPALDILALRPQLEQRVGVRVSGTAQNPRIRLYADPDMPDADKLAWLVLGRSPAAGGAESAVLQQAALALLSGNGKGLGGELADALGFDDISLANRSSTSATGTTASGTAVMLGKRLSKDFYLAYESSVSGAFGNLFIFYDLSRKLTLRAQAGELHALDLIYTIRRD